MIIGNLLKLFYLNLEKVTTQVPKGPKTRNTKQTGQGERL